MVRGTAKVSDDTDVMSEEEERRFDLVAVSVWFIAGAAGLFLLSLLVIAAGAFALAGGAHPARDPSKVWLAWPIFCFAMGLGLAVAGGLMWRSAARRLKSIRRQPPGFPVEPSGPRFER